MKLYEEKLLGMTDAGDECPLCKNGTVAIVGEVKPTTLEFVVNRETRCQGECGATTPTHYSILPGPGYMLPPDEKEKFTPKDLQTVRNLVIAFEAHLTLEAHTKDVSIEGLCPCSIEIEAARELLKRLDSWEV